MLSTRRNSGEKPGFVDAKWGAGVKPGAPLLLGFFTPERMSIYARLCAYFALRNTSKIPEITVSYKHKAGIINRL